MRLRNMPLRWKALALLLAACAIPLTASAFIEFRRSRDQLRARGIERLERRASELAGNIDDFNSAFFRTAGQIALLRQVNAYLAATPGQRPTMTAAPDVLRAVQVSDARLRGVSLFDARGV